MRNKLFMATIAAAIAIPVMVAPIPNHYAEAAETKGTVVLANNPFKDVKVNSPYYKIIHEMRDAGIIQGYEDGTFRPDTTISRQHAAALVSRALKINGLTLEKTKEFKQPKDLRTDSPFYEDIKSLVEAGLLEMDNQGNVNPNKALTRGEMAKIIAVAFNLEVKADYLFGDVKGSKYEEYVKALYSNGVTTGYEDYTFKLNGSLTRVHYVLFMHRAMNIDADFVAKPIPTPTPEPKPDPKPTSKSPVKYSDWSYQDIKTKIPRPAGYVAGEHEKKNAEIFKNLIIENGHRGKGSFNIEEKSWDSSSFTFEEKLRFNSEYAGVTYEEYVAIINQVIKTGEVYDGGTFAMYFNYQNGMIYESGTDQSK
ncbi:S-layer homology domain-containing protein [Lysinibacillus sphaericus]|uniref:S-layer homology domain-containing protein n=1 Tax=Lysinibacillus sphaericus TaxID=1421 RepID=UPI0004DF4BFE|nr:S-layer homology domain-containing protein [Lysinibacillus sphaericus]QPA60593.1 S-layer homology domain-containing protein [Lysinibacillus sphaericus]